jgi:hypothetical protein
MLRTRSRRLAFHKKVPTASESVFGFGVGGWTFVFIAGLGDRKEDSA